MKKIIYILIGLFAFGSYAQGGPKVDVIKFRGEVTTAVRNTFDVPVGETWLIWNESNNRLEIAQSNDVWKLLLTEDLFSWPNVWTGSSNTFETNVVIGEEGVYGGGLDLIGNIPVSGFNIQFYNNDYDTPLGIVGYNTTEGLKLENNTSSKSLKLLNSGLLTYNGQMTVSDDAYDATDWNGNLEVPTKNAVRDKIESMGSGGTIDTSITDGSTNAVENNAIFDALALKADASSLSSYLLKSGGTMTGQINFGGYNTNNIGSLFLNNSVLPAVVTDASINANAGYNAIKSISSGFRFGLSENTNNFKLTFDSLTSTKTLNFTDSDVTWNGVSLVSGGGTDDQTAAEVPITDSGAYFTGTDVEAALQELGAGTAGGAFGIVAEGTFDTTSGTGTYTVTHGLGYAPANTRISIQEIDNPICCANQPTSIENITTTTFDVVTTTNTNFNYAWRIFGTGSTTALNYTEVASGLDTELGSSDWRTGVSTAADVTLADANGNTSETNVEGAIDEIYESLNTTAVGETVLSSTRAALVTDKNGIITNSTVSNYTYTINAGIFEVGEMLHFENFSTGDIVIAYGAGVTGDDAQTININGSLTLWQRTLNDWEIFNSEAVLTQAEYTALSAGLKANTRFNFLFTD